MRRPEAGLLALAMLAAACAIPTEAPNWDVAWNLPIPQDSAWSIGISNFLPAGVTTVGTPATAFQAAISSVPPISRTLGAQCPSCPSATAPKPAFTAPPSTTTIALTAGTTLTSATLTTGSTIAVALNNGFGFDPIKPPGAPGSPGTITLTVTNGTTTLGTLTLNGATSAIPAGQTSNFSIPLSGTIVTSSPITITMTMDSPAGAAGSPVTMNPSQTFTATATPTIRISTATVAIPAQSLSTPGDSLDLSGIDSTIAARIVDSATTQGSLFLTVTNPFTVGAAAVLTFTGGREQENSSTLVPITPVVKNITLPAGTASSSTSTVVINLTGQELRRMIGSHLQAKFSGSTVAGSTTVTPAAKIAITGRMQLRLYVREIK